MKILTLSIIDKTENVNLTCFFRHNFLLYLLFSELFVFHIFSTGSKHNLRKLQLLLTDK